MNDETKRIVKTIADSKDQINGVGIYLNPFFALDIEEQKKGLAWLLGAIESKNQQLERINQLASEIIKWIKK